MSQGPICVLNTMTNTIELEFVRILREGTGGLPWPQRRLLVQQVAEVLAHGDFCESALELIRRLAADAKWEVRSDVAALLPLLPERDFARLSAALSDDPNGFVRSATQRALDRRQRGQAYAHRAAHGLDQVDSQWETLERAHGKPAAEKARRIADRLFDHLVGATVHEIWGVLTPLKASVASIGQQLKQGNLDPVNLRRQSDRAASRIAFLEQLVEDMRSYAQPVSEQRSPERLADIVAEAVEMVRENVTAVKRNPKRTVVECDVPDTITLEVARHQVVAAVANVVKNAFESYATGPGKLGAGKVTIVANVVDGKIVELTVSDCGMGISPVDLDELRQFIPGRTSKKNYGTGFGLPITRRNIMAHGGTLGIKSVEGEGTTVTIVFPLERLQGEKP